MFSLVIIDEGWLYFVIYKISVDSRCNILPNIAFMFAYVIAIRHYILGLYSGRFDKAELTSNSLIIKISPPLVFDVTYKFLV